MIAVWQTRGVCTRNTHLLGNAMLVCLALCSMTQGTAWHANCNYCVFKHVSRHIQVSAWSDPYHASEKACRPMLLQGGLQHLAHRLDTSTLDGCLGKVQRHCGCRSTGTAETSKHQVLPCTQLGVSPPAFHFLTQPAYTFLKLGIAAVSGFGLGQGAKLV